MRTACPSRASPSGQSPALGGAQHLPDPACAFSWQPLRILLPGIGVRHREGDPSALAWLGVQGHPTSRLCLPQGAGEKGHEKADDLSFPLTAADGAVITPISQVREVEVP